MQPAKIDRFILNVGDKLLNPTADNRSIVSRCR